MIRPLRKRHLQIWSLWALLLPAGIVVAVLSRPHPATGRLLQPGTETALPVLIKEVRKENYIVRLRGYSASSPQQLEWINTSVLRHPTALIYQTEPGSHSIQGARLIGRIEARGSYHFNLGTDPVSSYHFILYDFIKEQRIDSVGFSVTPNNMQP